MSSKIKDFCSNETYLNQLKVFSESYKDELDSLDVKATFDCVTKFFGKLKIFLNIELNHYGFQK